MKGTVSSREALESFESFKGIATTAISSTESGIGIHSLVAVGVIELTFSIVRQDFVSSSSFFEFVGCRFVVLRSVIFGKQYDEECVVEMAKFVSRKTTLFYKKLRDD